MAVPINDSKATRLFFPQKPENRLCPACGHPQRYDYKSSGRHFYQLTGLYYVDGQIVYCHNGTCSLRYKPMHPPEELLLAPPGRGHGFDVMACIGHRRYGDEMTRPEIKAWLEAHHPALVISERQIQNLWELYGALVSQSTLADPAVIAKIKTNRVMVLSLDGAKPILGQDAVWFVRDLVSGITLAAKAMASCTTASLVELLTPLKRFAQKHRVQVVGIVSDKENKLVAAVKGVFPKVRHQYCQLHFVTNLAKPLVKADRKLLGEVRESLSGKVADVEKLIQAHTGKGQALSQDESAMLQELCLAIRSVLRFNAKPPFDPPGLRLLENLSALRELVRQMRLEKGALLPRPSQDY
jgi:hypothetical protein